MPVHKVTLQDGTEGWRYGATGKIYTGPDARKKAEQQAAAVHANGWREHKTASYSEFVKMSAMDPFKPNTWKVETPKGIKPKFSIPTYNDFKAGTQAQGEQAQKKNQFGLTDQQMQTLRQPGTMDVTIRFSR